MFVLVCQMWNGSDGTLIVVFFSRPGIEDNQVANACFCLMLAIPIAKPALEDFNFLSLLSVPIAEPALEVFNFLDRDLLNSATNKVCGFVKEIISHSASR